ncbi:MAG: thiamine pyrophosphate-dependent enzyme [Bacteriovoracaceae bacterium]
MEETLQHHTYTKDNAVFPFCKGCGHHHYVNHLDEALFALNIDPKNVCIVSDIGCIGILDSLFATPHTFHTTHGRSTAFATGIELADGILRNSKLKTIVVIGDGGATIGLLHLVNAALMNVDVTVILANNFLYGMTGGQHSQFSPLEFVTPTTPAGNIVPPIDICSIMKSCGATYIKQAVATDKNLGSIIADAVNHPGFAMVEVLELCTEWAVPFNKFDGKTMNEKLRHSNDGGVPQRKDFATLYKEKVLGNLKKTIDDTITPAYTSALNGSRRIVLAGTAGEKVQLASFLYMKSAIASGLHATQKNDNPVTQGSGFSLSELCVSNDEILFTGIDQPDAVIIASADGLKEVLANGTLSRCVAETIIIADQTLPEFECAGKISRLPLRALCTGSRAALSALAALNVVKGWISQDALWEMIDGKFKDKSGSFHRDIEALMPFIKT